MQDDIRLPFPHQRLQVIKHGRGQYLTEQVRQVPVEYLRRFEPVVFLVRKKVGQSPKSHINGKTCTKRCKAGGPGAQTHIRAASYSHLMPHVPERLRER